MLVGLQVRIFSLMDESILDAIRERLKQRTYISSSTVLHRGGLVEKMVFIVRGEMESIGEDGSVLPLSEGDVCGEELLTWCLERSSVNPGTSLVDSMCSQLSMFWAKKLETLHPCRVYVLIILNVLGYKLETLHCIL